MGIAARSRRCPLGRWVFLRRSDQLRSRAEIDSADCTARALETRPCLHFVRGRLMPAERNPCATRDGPSRWKQGVWRQAERHPRHPQHPSRTEIAQTSETRARQRAGPRRYIDQHKPAARPGYSDANRRTENPRRDAPTRTTGGGPVPIATISATHEPTRMRRAHRRMSFSPRVAVPRLDALWREVFRSWPGPRA
jgi:hypothetical protein